MKWAMKCSTCGLSLRRVAMKGKIYDMCPDPKCGVQTQPEGIKIQTLYLFVTEDDKGNEILVSRRTVDADVRTYTPMVAADLQRVAQLIIEVPEDRKRERSQGQAPHLHKSRGVAALGLLN